VCRENNFALEAACWYNPEFSPLFRPLVIHQNPEEPLGILIQAWIVGFLVVAGPILCSMQRWEPAVTQREKTGFGSVDARQSSLENR